MAAIVVKRNAHDRAAIPPPTWSPASTQAWRRRTAYLITVFLGWLAVWLWLMRYHQLDDSFITLRYAHNLHLFGYLAYNPGEPSHGTSSLLYVGILSTLYSFLPSPFLTKAVSSIAYVVLCLLVLRFTLRTRRQDLAFAWAAFLLLLVSPMAVRWLSDGMETSLCALDGLVLAWLAANYQRDSRMLATTVAFAIGAASVFLRVEAILLVAAAAIAGAVGSIEELEISSPKALLRRHILSLALLVGGLAACALTILIFGHLLPDTALAKTHSSSAFRPAYLVYMARSTGGTYLLGVGLLFLVISTAMTAYSVAQSNFKKVAILVENSPYIALVLLAWSRGQEAQFRYFIASLVFAVSSNLFTLDKICEAEKELSWLPKATVVLFVSFALIIVPEARAAYHITNTRSQAFLSMQDQELDHLSQGNGIAFDIGMIGYFSDAFICDVDGLVEGRAWAQTAVDRRMRSCVKRSPEFVFVNPQQAQELQRFIDLRTMVACSSYDLPNASGADPHTLYVASQVAAKVCGFSRGRAS